MKNINLMTLVAFLVGFGIAYLYTAEGENNGKAASDHDQNTNEDYAANLEVAQKFMQLHEVEDLESQIALLSDMVQKCKIKMALLTILKDIKMNLKIWILMLLTGYQEVIH